MTRRAAGEGHIYRRKDGRWEGKVEILGQDGQLLRKSVYARTQREVRDKLPGAIAELRVRADTPSAHQTLAEFLEDWLRTKRQLRPSTFRRYAEVVHLHLVPGVGRIRLEKLTPQAVQRFLNRKLEEGLKPRTVLHLRAVLRTALNQGVRWGTVPRNVAALAEPPRTERYQAGFLSQDEARRLLGAAEGDRLEALYVVALMLGLRQGELLGLRWSDVDLEAGRLTVQRALQRVDGKLVAVEPKTTRSRRTVPMPVAVAEALRRHRGRQAEEQGGAIPGPGAYIFTTPIGTPLDAANVRHDFQQLLAAARVRRIRFHDLRHSCASLLLALGVAPRTVMEVLGHSQISLTMDTYTHVMPSVLEEAAAAMDKLLG